MQTSDIVLILIILFLLFVFLFRKKNDQEPLKIKNKKYLKKKYKIKEKKIDIKTDNFRKDFFNFRDKIMNNTGLLDDTAKVIYNNDKLYDPIKISDVYDNLTKNNDYRS